MARFFGRDVELVNESTALLQVEQYETLPPKAERLYTGYMERKVMTSKGVEWQPRFAVLTRDKLSFTKGPADDNVIDYIPLYEIEHVYLEKVHVDPEEQAKLAKKAPEHIAAAHARRNRSGSVLKGLAVVVPVKHTQSRREAMSNLEKERAERDASSSSLLASPGAEAHDVRQHALAVYGGESDVEWHLTIATTDEGCVYVC